MKQNNEIKKANLLCKEDLQESLRFSLYPRDWLQRYGNHGLELMTKLIGIGYHLPLFASVDIVCAFFSAFHSTHAHLTQLHVSNNRFKDNYDKYKCFVRMVGDFHAFKKISRLEKKNRSRLYDISTVKKQGFLYQAFEFILMEISMGCPFMQIESIYDHTMLIQTPWSHFTLPEEEGLLLNDESQLLAKLGLSEYECQLLPLETNRMGRIGILVETCFHVYKSKMLDHLERKTFSTIEKKQSEGEEVQGKQKTYLSDLSRTSHLFDYKLIDLYMKYYNQYEPSEELQRKIAILKHYTRTAIERNPFYTQCDKQDRSGMPNPAYLILGLERFFLKMMEGEPVFIGNDSPIREQDNTVIRFYFIEEMRSISEKIEEGDSGGTHHHLTVHKLIALLLCHDIITYLGVVTHMDIRMEFYIYREPITYQHDGMVQSTNISMKYLRERSKMGSGFLTTVKQFQEDLFMEASVLETGHARFDRDFFEKFFDSLSASMKSSKGYKNLFNVFFGKGGTYLDGNNGSQLNGGGLEGNHENNGRFTLSKGLSAITEKKSVRSLFDHPSNFFCESNHHYIVANRNADDHSLFTQFIEDKTLSVFLEQTRESFLNLAVDEAIKMISEKSGQTRL